MRLSNYARAQKALLFIIIVSFASLSFRAFETQATLLSSDTIRSTASIRYVSLVNLRSIGKTGFQYTAGSWQLNNGDFDLTVSALPNDALLTINFGPSKLMPRAFNSSPNYSVDSDFAAFLETYFSLCDKKGIKVIIVNEQPDTTPTDYWSNQIYRNGVAEVFKYMAANYPTIIGFDPVNEPWQKIEATSDADFVAHRDFEEYIIDAFRSIRPNLLAFVQGPVRHWRPGAMSWVTEFPIRRADIYYTFHVYSNTWDNSSGWVDKNVYGYYSWVSDYKSGNYQLGKEELRNELYGRWGFIKDLNTNYGHDIFLGEFAANPNLAGGVQYLKDLISILNDWNASGSYYCWFSPEHRPMTLLEEDHVTLRQTLIDVLNNNFFIG